MDPDEDITFLKEVIEKREKGNPRTKKNFQKPNLQTSKNQKKEELQSINLKALLQVKFGFTEFRGGQLKTLLALNDDRDCTVLQTTGSGKSLIHQLFSLSRPGIGLVIVPTVGIMANQVDKAKGKFGAFSLTTGWEAEFQNILAGKYKGKKSYFQKERQHFLNK